MEPARPPLWLPVGAAAVLIGALAGLWYVTRRPAAVPPKAAPAVAETTVDATRPAPRNAAEPGEDIDLPPLDDSDALIRTLVSRLSSHPQVAAWLSTDELVRNMAVVIANIAEGQTPAKHLRANRPVGAFGVTRAGGTLTIDPNSYTRYDTIAAAVESLDARGVARFYATIKPRLAEAYAELGLAEPDLDRAVERAIVTLLRTPVVDGPIAVRASSVSYTFADPNLEALSKAQKQFIRMGPRNMRIVKGTLREVAQHLGIPESSLPARDQG